MKYIKALFLVLKSLASYDQHIASKVSWDMPFYVQNLHYIYACSLGTYNFICATHVVPACKTSLRSHTLVFCLPFLISPIQVLKVIMAVMPYYLHTGTMKPSGMFLQILVFYKFHNNWGFYHKIKDSITILYCVKMVLYSKPQCQRKLGEALN